MNRMVSKPPCLAHIPPHDLGWVMVFDLDNTIVGEYYNVRKHPPRKLPLNPFAVQLLQYGIQERDKEKGTVSTILLLTNNNDTDFINLIDSQLQEVCGCDKVFDCIIDSNHPLRETIHGGPMHGTHMKSIKDILRFVRLLEKPHEDLLKRCIFIDDQIYHKLAIELIAAGYHQQFIHIHPPYCTPEPLLIPNIPRCTNRLYFPRVGPSTAVVHKRFPPLQGSAPWK